MFTHQAKVQSKEKNFTLLIYKGKMPILAGIEHLSINFYSHRWRLSYLSTENVRT